MRLRFAAIFALLISAIRRSFARCEHDCPINRTALGVNDVERSAKALAGIEGKRLTYRRVNEAKDA
jgi:hypothetical protein